MTRARDDRPIDATAPNTGMTAVAASVVFVCFFLSGATGLVYQVVWLRMLSLTFGHTVYAITTVLAAFMAGLALGSLLFARVAGRVRRPIMAYGLIEIGSGVSCALTPLLFSAAAEMSRSSGGFAFVQFALVVVVLLVPTALMGATLPLLSEAVARDPERTGRSVGMLYAANTFGAVVGVATAGYVLLPAVGNLRTVLLAVAANLVIGIVAVTLSFRYALDARQRAAGQDGAAAPSDRDDRSRPAVASSRTLMAAALAVSGTLSMTYEVAWTRALTLVIGSSTYAFTSMLLAFLVGIAGGSALYSWMRGARRVGVADFAVVQAGIAIAVVAPLLLFEWMPLMFLHALRLSQSPPFVQTLQFVVSAGALLPSTLLIGATFPCAVAIVGREAPGVGRLVGRLYAANTVGAIAGSVLAGLVLIPAVGVQTSLKIGAAGTALLAGALLVARASGTVSPEPSRCTRTSITFT